MLFIQVLQLPGDGGQGRLSPRKQATPRKCVTQPRHFKKKWVHASTEGRPSTHLGSNSLGGGDALDQPTKTCTALGSASLPAGDSNLDTGLYNHPWEDRKNFYCTWNRAEVDVRGQGSSYQNAIQMCLLMDYGFVASASLITHTLYHELLDKQAYYVDFHTIEGEDPDNPLPAKDRMAHMMAEVGQFFEDNLYRQSICDILNLATCNAFKLNIGTFCRSQQHNILLAVNRIPGATKTIYIQLRHSKYKSIVRKDPLAPTFTPGSPSSKYISTFPGMEHMVKISTAEVMQPPKESSSSSFLSPTSRDEGDTSQDNIEPTDLSTKASRSKFPLHHWRGKSPTIVHEIPGDIDGFKWYSCIVPEDNDWRDLQRDSRHFIMRSSRIGDKGLQQEVCQKVGWCQGSHFCGNEECEFFYFTARKNATQWERVRGMQGALTCFTCGSPAMKQPCNGRKLTQYNKRTRELNVFHINRHSCTLKVERGDKDDYLKNLVEENPGLSVGEVQEFHVMQAIRQKDLGAAYERANLVSDTRRLRYVSQQVKKSGSDHSRTQSIEAMIDLQKLFNQWDKFLLYKFNMEGMSSDLPWLAFKTCKSALQVAMVMDCDSNNSLGTTPNPMKKELAFFDGQHSRVKGFITLALYTTLAPLRRVICLARMEALKEDQVNVALFFWYLNKCIQEFSGDDNAFFNPRGIVTDMAGGIIHGVQQAFSMEYATRKLKGCQQHYLKNMSDHSSVMEPSARGHFMDLATAAIKCTNEVQYDKVFEQLRKFSAMYPKLLNKVDWWHARKYQNVDVFWGIQFRRTNLAEAGHSSFTKKHGPMWLVEACESDASKFMLQERAIDNFLEGKIRSTGQAANQKATIARDKEYQRRAVRGFRSVVDTLVSEKAKGNKYPFNKPEDSDVEESTVYLPPEKEGFKPGKGNKKVKPTRPPASTITEVLGDLEKRRRVKKTVAQLLAKHQEAEQFIEDVMEGHAHNEAAMEFWKPSDMWNSSSDEEVELDTTLTERLKKKRRRTAAEAGDNETVILEVSDGQRSKKRRKPQTRKKGPSMKQCNRRPKAQTYRFMERAHLQNMKPFPLEVPKEENPPFLVYLNCRSIRRCQGCKGTIDNPAKEPDNLVFTLLAHRPFHSTSGFKDKIAPIYFHCEFGCLQEFDPTIEPQHLTMEIEQYKGLTPNHLKKLATQELLRMIKDSVTAAAEGIFTNLVLITVS